MVTETRKLGRGLNTLVVYTEDQGVRRALKTLAGFTYETHYFCGHRLVAADLYFVANGDLASLEKSIDKVVSLADT